MNHENDHTTHKPFALNIYFLRSARVDINEGHGQYLGDKRGNMQKMFGNIPAMIR